MAFSLRVGRTSLHPPQSFTMLLRKEGIPKFQILGTKNIIKWCVGRTLHSLKLMALLVPKLRLGMPSPTLRVEQASVGCIAARHTPKKTIKSW